MARAICISVGDGAVHGVPGARRLGEDVITLEVWPNSTATWRTLP
jgi:hypothetical protein